jgi:shikimate kinase
MSQTIYLMGMKHTGKTRHGLALARARRRTFLDTDGLIQELDAAEGTLRRTIRDIYAEDGPDRFRQLELVACELASQREGPTVVATGGGLCDNSGAVQATRGGIRIHLVDSLEALEARVFRVGIPAFLHTSDPDAARTRFRELYRRRVAAYDEITDLRVDLTGQDVATAERTVLDTVEEYLSGR